VISPDLTKDLPQENLVFGTITTIAISPVDNEVIYAGTDDGNIQLTDDGGETWTLVSNSLPNRWVTSVATDPVVRVTAYATFSGLKFGENIGHIYKTNDLGENWINITGNLPDIPVNDILKSPVDANLYVATDIGVFYSEDEGIEWQRLGNDLPNVVIMDLDYHKGENMLAAATYGRGMFTFDLDQLNTSVLDTYEDPLMVYPNPFSDHLNIQFPKDERGDYSIVMYNSTGQITFIQERNIQGEVEKFKTPKSLEAGAYYLKVINHNTNSVRILKLIKI
jgi:hypothetical protein